MKPGDRVFIADREHLYAGCEGTLVVQQRTNWLIRLDNPWTECRADEDQLIGPSQAKSIDAVRASGKFAARGQGC